MGPKTFIRLRLAHNIEADLDESDTARKLFDESEGLLSEHQGESGGLRAHCLASYSQFLLEQEDTAAAMAKVSAVEQTLAG